MKVIDNSRIYKARVRKGLRSNVTITWNIENEAIMKECIA